MHAARSLALLSALVLPACVLDRTGTSATSGLEREMALRDARVAELERVEGDSTRRIQQLEEVIRYRGQQEAEKLENIDQVREMVGSLSGDVEVLRHELENTSELGDSFREDTDFRLTWLELRVEALEENLGLKPPPPPEREEDEASAEERAGDEGGGDRVRGGEGEEAAAVEAPEDLLALAKEHLAEGRPRAARAVLERFVAAYGDHELADEAYYRLAESYYNNKEYQQAILPFQEVVDRFGGTGWAAWAMVRQGECFRELGKDAEADLFWEDVVRLYPRSKAAEEAKRLLGR